MIGNFGSTRIGLSTKEITKITRLQTCLSSSANKSLAATICILIMV